VTLRLTAATEYRAFLSGEFLGQGPARGPHGFFRVDEWPLAVHLCAGTNSIAIEVAGYNVNSFALLINLPSCKAKSSRAMPCSPPRRAEA